MKPSSLAALGLLASALLTANAQAASFTAHSNVLDYSATVGTPFADGDTLGLDTLVTFETGSLRQTLTFTVGAGVTEFFGNAVWLVNPPEGTAPRLVGVNVDLLDNFGTVLFSDQFTGLVGVEARSTLGGPIGPGTYTLEATGFAQRDASLEIALTFGPRPAVPEPTSSSLMLAGLGAAGLLARLRRSR